MSHVVQSTLKVENNEALLDAVAALNLELVDNGTFKTHQMYGSQRYDGVGVKLEGWSYPVVFNTNDGSINYDNYKGSWGNISELDSLLQQYTKEVINQEAEANGYNVIEEIESDGTMSLTMEKAAY